MKSQDVGKSCKKRKKMNAQFPEARQKQKLSLRLKWMVDSTLSCECRPGRVPEMWAGL